MYLVRQTAVFLMVVNLLTMLVNSESYRKYIKIFAGLLLLLMLLRPVTRWFSGRELEEIMEDRLTQFAILEVDRSLENVNEEASEAMKRIYEEKTAESILLYLREQKLAVREVTVSLQMEKEAMIFDRITVVVEGNRRTAEAQQAYIGSLLTEKYGIDKECILVDTQ